MVRWTNPAKRDLKKIHDYIAEDSRFYAKKVVETLVAKAELLSDMPEMGRMIPEFGDSSIRELIIFSYRLVYEVKTDHVDILTIIHGKRDFVAGYQEGRQR